MKDINEATMTINLPGSGAVTLPVDDWVVILKKLIDMLGERASEPVAWVGNNRPGEPGDSRPLPVMPYEHPSHVIPLVGDPYTVTYSGGSGPENG